MSCSVATIAPAAKLGRNRSAMYAVIPRIDAKVAQMPRCCRSAPITGPTTSVCSTSNLPMFAFANRLDDLPGPQLEVEALFLAGLRQAHEDRTVGGVAVGLHDLLAGQARDRVTHLLLGHGLVELHDDDRAAREVDAERQAAPRRRSGRGPPG